jgi:hypothetical protein
MKSSATMFQLIHKFVMNKVEFVSLNQIKNSFYFI